MLAKGFSGVAQRILDWMTFDDQLACSVLVA